MLPFAPGMGWLWTSHRSGRFLGKTLRAPKACASQPVMICLIQISFFEDMFQGDPGDESQSHVT